MGFQNMSYGSGSPLTGGERLTVPPHIIGLAVRSALCSPSVQRVSGTMCSISGAAAVRWPCESDRRIVDLVSRIHYQKKLLAENGRRAASQEPEASASSPTCPHPTLLISLSF
ncbi:hypothetical protein EYF80_040460 [Liparis tanakae]|uniref:Uncharacterized protein n=1 Tax=Liparis tanakae TaxID=230148 RepID=A0A4Z2G873_9TELE|nr:hypothetical protein EYF80_040460 [Liparis tanakae]